MNFHNVKLTTEARADLKRLAYVIREQYKAPITAYRYLNEIAIEIKKLSISANSYRIQEHIFFQQYGPSPRRINYKEMAIIYNLINDEVYIRRVIPSNTIQDL